MDRAPALESLLIRYGVLERQGGLEGPAVPYVPRKEPLAKRIFRCKSIRPLDADDSVVQYLVGEMPTEIPRDWMPNLLRLSMWDMVRTNPHPRLGALSWISLSNITSGALLTSSLVLVVCRHTNDWSSSSFGIRRMRTPRLWSTLSRRPSLLDYSRSGSFRHCATSSHP